MADARALCRPDSGALHGSECERREGQHGLRGPMIVAKLRLYARARSAASRLLVDLGWRAGRAGADDVYRRRRACWRASPSPPARPRGRQSALLPDTTGFDLEALRQVADRTAASERPGFKLFAILLHLAHDELLNRRAEARDVPLDSRRHAFITSATPPYWYESLEIEIQRAPPKPAWATRHTVPQTRRSTRRWPSVRLPEGFWMPQPVPADSRRRRRRR